MKYKNVMSETDKKIYGDYEGAIEMIREWSRNNRNHPLRHLQSSKYVATLRFLRNSLRSTIEIIKNERNGEFEAIPR
jgi:hypothetical protein